MDISQLRREYLRGGLRRRDLDPDPIAQFRHWLDQAGEVGISDPTAMCVATVAADGQPSQRIVLLKQLDERGFVFYTNLGSRKARDLEGNPRASLLFPWHPMDRQVKVRGVVSRLPAAEVLRYFATRPRDSQLSAWASDQSRPVSSRNLLLAQFAAMREKFAKGEVPLPDFWGGYRVEPHAIEFWQGGADRLHDRFEYTRCDKGSWAIARLAP